MVPVINQVFMAYSNLLTEEARHPWTKIVEEQINFEPWTDLYKNDDPKNGVLNTSSRYMNNQTLTMQ